MKDTELYHRLLGLQPPWEVKGVRLELEKQEIEVEVVCADQVWGCPVCRKRAHIHSHERRRWRHLDSCQCKTYVVADVPRVRCEEHGTVTVQVPWAEKRSRFTLQMECLAIQILLRTSIKSACQLLRVSWAEADGIKQRAVKRGLARKKPQVIRRFCVDEKGIGRGYRFLTVVLNADDPAGAKIEYIGEDRTRKSLEAYWQGLKPEQLAGIEAVAMDLWKPYAEATKTWVPGSEHKIVHDPFHLLRHMNEAVDTVRKLDHSVFAWMPRWGRLNFRQMWLYGFENLPEKYRKPFDYLRDRMKRTARAWELKELLREFFRLTDVESAQAFFNRWYSKAIRSRLAPVKYVAKMLRKHLANVMTFFKHRLTTAPSEGTNSILAGIIKKACGYRNRERFKTDAFFHAGGLNLYPSMS